MNKMSKEEFENKRTEDTLAMPLHTHFGLYLIHREAGYAEAGFNVGENAKTAAGTLHGGILYALMDATSLLSLIAHLNTSEHAVSHSVNFSLMNPAFAGDDIVMKSRVMKRGKKTAFMHVEAWCKRDGSDICIASGHVTKSIIKGYD